MRQFITLFLLFSCCHLSNIFAQIAINQDNSLPDSSAILDIKSTTQGLLIPRMTTTQRTAINSPATGLIVYDNIDSSFWFYSGIAWTELKSGNISSISDVDNDTKIQVEESADEDLIRLDVNGTEIAKFTKNTNGDMLFHMNNTNVIIGSETGGANTGDSNVFIGRGAARINTTESRNTVMGSEAGVGLVDGVQNVYIGTVAGRDNVSGIRNTLVGDGAGAISTGSSNVAIGLSTGATSGNNNVFVGVFTGSTASAGENNTMVGYGSGGFATGSNNVFLGNHAGLNETGDNKLYIDNSGTGSPLIYGEFDNNALTINGTLTSTGVLNANAGISLPSAFGPDAAYVGTTGNSISFAHVGSSEDFLGYKDNAFYFKDSPNGGDTADPSVHAAAFNTYSSRRWKHNIQDLNNALSIVQQLRGVTYTWNEDHGGEDDFGFIAEEVHEVLPRLAPKGKDGEVNGVSYGEITPYLVEAIKEQQTQIQDLKNKNKDLNTQLQSVLKRLDTLENKK